MHVKPLSAFLRTAIVLVSLLWGGLATATAPHYALIIGHNDSTDPELSPLRYADDDAIRYHELFDLIATETTLLTERDEETHRLYPLLEASKPTRANVMKAIRSIGSAIEKDVGKGLKPIFSLIFSGHGSYDADGSGFLYLEDATFTTRDLYDEVIAPNSGAQIVLVIDACNAALLVHSRGGGGDRVASAPSKLKLEAYPNVGVILSSSSVGEVHEWGRYLSGVFSHEVRSALLGPGDIDGDRRITFPELASFIAAANDAVDNPTIRLNPYIRPPMNDPNMALIDMDTARFPARIRIENNQKARGFMMDSRLVRYLDFHMGAGRSFEVGLVHNTRGWIVVQEDQEYRVPEGAIGTLSLQQIPAQKLTTVATRGATSSYFEETLFDEPFSIQFASNFLNTDYPASLVVERFEMSEWYETPWGWGLSGVALGAFAAGGLFHREAMDAQNRAERALYTQDRELANNQISTNQAGMYTLYGIGGAALTGAILSFVFDRNTQVDVYNPPFSVQIAPSGVIIETSLP